MTISLWVPPQLHYINEPKRLKHFFSVNIVINWLIDFNGISTFLRSFYVLKLGNHVHCTFIFTFFCVVVLKSFFYIQCNQIQVIFKKIYLTYRWDPDRYYNSRSVDLGVMAMKGYFTLPRFSELEPRHRMQFSVVPKTSFFGGVPPLQGIECILSSTNWVVLLDLVIA